jgi:hypothetical protein
VDDDTEGNFWVENAFRIDTHRGDDYCSRDNARNIVLASVLETGIPLSKKRKQRLSGLLVHTIEDNEEVANYINSDKPLAVSTDSLVKLYERKINPEIRYQN